MTVSLQLTFLIFWNWTPWQRHTDIDLVSVPAGMFWEGDDHGQADERPRRRVYVHTFAIQRHEVTVRDYALCVLAGRCTAPAHPSARPDLPVTWVSFDQAQAYCHFVGLRLPTEREWEKAAAGPKGLRFPWGNEPDCRRANFGNYDGQGPCARQNPGKPEPIGLRPQGRSPYGIEEMAGNVWEWTVGPKGRATVRGGSCCSIFLLPRTANRIVLPHTYRDGDIGFRCAGTRTHSLGLDRKKTAR